MTSSAVLLGSSLVSSVIAFDLSGFGTSGVIGTGRRHPQGTVEEGDEQEQDAGDEQDESQLVQTSRVGVLAVQTALQRRGRDGAQVDEGPQQPRGGGDAVRVGL